MSLRLRLRECHKFEGEVSCTHTRKANPELDDLNVRFTTYRSTQSVHTVRTVTRTSNSRACTKPPRGAPWKLAGHLAVHMSGTETVTTCIVSGVVQREPYSLITRFIEVSDSLTQVASHPNGQYAVKIR